MKDRESRLAKLFEDRLLKETSARLKPDVPADPAVHSVDSLDADLDVVARLRRESEAISIPQELLTDRKAEVMAGIRRAPRARVAAAQRQKAPVFWLRFGLAGSVIMMLLMVTGVVFASQASLPGDVLHPVKLAVEDWRLTVTRGTTQRSEVYFEMAETRLDELEQLTAGGQLEGLQEGLNGYEASLQSSLAFLDADSDVSEQKAQLAVKLEEKLARHVERLEALREKLPDSAQKGINQAIMVSTHGLTVAQYAVQKSRPTQTPGSPTPTQTATLTATPTFTATAQMTATEKGAPGSGNGKKTPVTPTRKPTLSKTPGPPDTTPPGLVDKTKEPNPLKPTQKPTKTPKK